MQWFDPDVVCCRVAGNTRQPVSTGVGRHASIEHDHRELEGRLGAARRRKAGLHHHLHFVPGLVHTPLNDSFFLPLTLCSRSIRGSRSRDEAFMFNEC
jgi:hypothetical protein